MKKNRILFMILTALIFSACSQNPGTSPSGGSETPPPSSGDNSGAGGGDGEPDVNFQVIRSQVFANHCLGCHSGGVNLETYDSTVRKLGSIRAAVVSGRMPLGSVLPADKKGLLLNWIDSGAPQ